MGLIKFALFLLLIRYSHSISSPINNVIIKHFGSTGGGQLYFCRTRDALTAMRSSIDMALLFKSHTLGGTAPAQDITVNCKTPQILGVFLDLSCDSGKIFLNQAKNMFNGSYVWLLWTTNYNYTIDILKKSRVLADSKVTLMLPLGNHKIKILDVHRMHRSLQFTITDITEWYENGKFISYNSQPKRGDFHGAVIIASLIVRQSDFNISDISLYTNTSFMRGIGSYQRFSSSLLITMAESLNITFNYILESQWGYPQANGFWSGFIGQLQNNTSEIAVAALFYTIDRFDYIDYLMSVFTFRNCFTIKQPPVFGSSGSLIRPLGTSVWVTVLVVSALGVAAIRITTKYDRSSKQTDSSVNHIFLFVAAFSQQGIPESSEILSMRIIYFVIHFFTYFTMVFYNTALIYFLILPTPGAIQNMQQLLKSNMEIGLQNAPFFEYELSWNDSVNVQLRKKLTKQRLYSLIEGMHKIKKGGFAFYHADFYLYPKYYEIFEEAEICALREIEKYRPSPTGVAVQNNSPYKEFFNRKIIQMKENGIVYRLRNAWIPKKPECNWQLNAITIGIIPLSLTYAVMCLGYIASLTILLLEIINIRKRQLSHIK